MQINKVDLNLFIVLDAIYSERNLTRAADVLHITQPAVSNSLARLRRHFDDELFTRKSGHMVPTPLTENIIERIQQSLSGLESSLHEHNTFEPRESTRTFRFSMNDTSESYLLPRLMKALEDCAPNISVENYALPRDEVSKAFSGGDLDFALDVPLLNDTHLVHEPLAQDRFVCIARHDHPRIQGSMSLDQYLSEPHINISNRRKGIGHIDAHLNRLGLQREIKLRVQHFRAAPAIVESTDMLLTIPESLARYQSLQVLELPFALPNLDWHLYWASNYEKDNAHSWMRERIFDIFRTHSLSANL